MLQGSWKPLDEQPKEKEHRFFRLAGTHDYFNFKEDSFYYSTHRWTDVFGIPCNPEDGDEYARGTFKITGNKILMKGFWMDKTYSYVMDTGCYNKGAFQKQFYFYLPDKKTMIVNPKNGDNFDYDDEKPNDPIKRFIRVDK